MSLCRRTVEDRLPLERVPLACTFGSPLDLHVRQSLRLQGPVDLDHHRGPGGGGGGPVAVPQDGWVGGGGMRQRILGSHTPPCHRRMVITTWFSVFPRCTAVGGGA